MKVPGELKPQQCHAIRNVLERRDLFVNLPTGGCRHGVFNHGHGRFLPPIPNAIMPVLCVWMPTLLVTCWAVVLVLSGYGSL